MTWSKLLPGACITGLALGVATWFAGMAPADAAGGGSQRSWQWIPASAQGPVTAEVTPFRFGKEWAYCVEIDDGPVSTLTVSQPLLAQYFFTEAPPGVSGGTRSPFVGGAAVITCRTGTPNNTFLNWEQLRTLKAKGWSILNHGYAHVGNSWDPGAGLSANQIRRELLWSQAIFASELGVKGTPSHFVYPNGYTPYSSHLAEFGLNSGSRVAGSSRRNVLDPRFKLGDLDRNYLDESVWAKDPNPLLGLPSAPQRGDFVIDFTHGMDGNPQSPNGRRWRSRLGHLALHFGAEGDDSVWCASTSEFVSYTLARQAARVEIESGKVHLNLPSGTPDPGLTLHLTGIPPSTPLQAPPGGALYRRGAEVWVTFAPSTAPFREPAPLTCVYRGPVKTVSLDRPERIAGIRILQHGKTDAGFALSLKVASVAGEVPLHEGVLPENWGTWLLFPTVPEREALLGRTVNVNSDPCLREMEIWAISDPKTPSIEQTKQAPEPTSKTPEYEIQLDTIKSGFDGKTCWVHARAGTIPGRKPTVVVTMQKLLLTGSDVFFALNELRTRDLGKSWIGPTEHAAALGRRNEPDGVVVACCDFTPKWHSASRRLLGTGQSVRYLNDKVIADRARETTYSVYDEDTRTWTPWSTVQMPNEPKFYSCGAGSSQRLDLPNGDVLVPIYLKGREEKVYRAAVMRCAFDGKQLKYLEHGTELSLPSGRGLYEPSITRFGGRYYLTLRNDQAGYVATSQDGLHFGEPREWRFDDGTSLGNYNTQQHWVTHSDGLFLVYTRRGAQNDHVFRHRAPLFMAQVDPNRLCILRKTERMLVPQRGAGLGNFAVTDVSPKETWVLVSEWMQPIGCEKYGSDNSVYAARIQWKKPNGLHGLQ